MKKILIGILSLILVLSSLTGCTTNFEQKEANRIRQNELVSYGKRYSSYNSGMPYEAKMSYSGSSFSIHGVHSTSEVVGTAMEFGNRVVMQTDNGSGQRYVFEKQNEELKFMPEESSPEARRILPENIIFKPENY